MIHPFMENENTNQFVIQTERVPLLTLFITVVCAPLIEETFFRGVVFGSIRKHHRTLAYVVTTILFCTLHIWQPLAGTGNLHSLF